MARTNRRNSRRKIVSPEEPLRSVVYVNEAMEIVDLRGGGCRVTIPLRRPGWLVPPISWILPFSPHRRIELDALGTEILRLSDGKHTVEEIIENFAEKHKLSFREAQLSIGTLLKHLAVRGLIAIVGKNKDAGD